jgi:hypothetical protein
VLTRDQMAVFLTKTFNLGLTSVTIQ